MFSNFAWSEMLVIACVAIIVVGPKDLPAMLRQFGKTIGNIKRMAGDFQRQFNEAIQDAELDELKNMTSTKGFAPLEDAKKSMEEFAKSVEGPIEAEARMEETSADEISTPKTAAKPAAKKAAPKKAAPKKTAAKTATSKASAAKAAGAKTTAAKSATNGARKPAAKRAAPRKTAAATKRKNAAATKSTS